MSPNFGCHLSARMPHTFVSLPYSYAEHVLVSVESRQFYFLTSGTNSDAILDSGLISGKSDGPDVSVRDSARAPARSY